MRRRRITKRRRSVYNNTVGYSVTGIASWYMLYYQLFCLLWQASVYKQAVFVPKKAEVDSQWAQK